MIFDSDVLIWALRGNNRAASVIDQTDELEISIVTYMEVIHGVRDKRELRSTKKTIANMDIQILPLSENIGHRAAIYVEAYGLKSNLGMADALIAATALENDRALCTGNAKDYRAIAELELKVFRP